jgi:hypothetical protein
MTDPKTGARGRGPLRRALATAGLAVVLVGLPASPALAASGGDTPAAPTATAQPVPSRPATPPGAAVEPAQPAAPAAPSPSASPSAPGSRTVKPQIAWRIRLTVNPALLWVNQFSTLTATANANVAGTGDLIRILEGSLVVTSCTTGTTCSVAVTKPIPELSFYTAEVIDGRGNVLAEDPTPDGGFGLGVRWHATSVALAAGPSTLPVGNVSTLTRPPRTTSGPLRSSSRSSTRRPARSSRTAPAAPRAP